jgi:hypothetical protein
MSLSHECDPSMRHTVVSVTPRAHPLSDLMPPVVHNNTRRHIVTCPNFNVVSVSGISPALHMESI